MAPVSHTVPAFYLGGMARPVTTLSGLLLAQEAGAADEVDKATLAL